MLLNHHTNKHIKIIMFLCVQAGLVIASVVYSNSTGTSALCLYSWPCVIELIGNGYFTSEEGMASGLLFAVCNVIDACAANAECVFVLNGSGKVH